MSTIEIRHKMLELIKNEDESTSKSLYKLIMDYKHQRHLDKMIAKGEEDIKTGRVHSLDEVKDFIDSWKM